jgi:7-cyano-7-deazaguanine reductase
VRSALPGVPEAGRLRQNYENRSVTTPKKYSRLSLLGHTAKFPEHPKAATLETFRNENAKRDYRITFECMEFTSMCPVTGQPDFAKIRIEYIPDELCIETKSLKFYLASFRNTRSFNEAIVNRILDDIVEACRPRHAIVHGEFAPRGGIGVIVDAEFPDRPIGNPSPAFKAKPSTRNRAKS